MRDETLCYQRMTCRVCASDKLEKVLSLGSTPPANAFLKKEDLTLGNEQSFPLELFFCKDCSFVQLGHVVSPDLLFHDYVYVSSTSPVFVSHFQSFSREMVEKFKLTADSLVVDIGSNDGILLRPYKEQGMQVMGIDPAENIAKLATESGIETKAGYFTSQIAEQVKQEKGTATLMTATSVFPHIDNLDEVIEGVKVLLADNGVFVIEAYYLVDLLEKNLFDTVYHEHLSYFTVQTLKTLFERTGLELFDVEKTDTHGGSLRVFVQKKGGMYHITEAVGQFIQEEQNKKVSHIETWHAFEQKIHENKIRLKELLADLKSQGKRIVGYGAPAKGNTLLNYFGIGADVIDYIVDDNAWKQGLYTPGMHIPVVSIDQFQVTAPDYILILAWNFAEPIMKRCSPFVRFILPVPFAQVVNRIVEEDLEIIAEGIKEERSKLEGKTVFITGGSGFLGSYFIAVIDLLNRKYFAKPCKVLSADNHIVGKRNNLLKDILSEHITFINHNVCNPISIDEPVDYIISAAGVASPVYYKRYPIETIEGTIFGLKNALELAREKKSQSILYFSSSEIYGDPDPNAIPTPETYKGNVSSIGPRSCYDESKRLGETLAQAFHQVHNVPVKTVRPFNVYGPGMSAKDYRVVPTFLSQAIEGKSLTVHDKGNQTRTFCYVTDAMTGFFKVLLSEKGGEVYNVGNDNDEINMKSLGDIVAKEIVENKIEVNLVNYPDTYPQDEPKRRSPDLTKIKTSLGYSPKIDLKTGLRRSYEWMKSVLT
ncbi:MAG: NAD-dependent epimerase/dehydratase family protein [Candidatus Magasanikbacteria bacterium]|nr:NAD-dependent epimerase/dehydratase family protein [Candidatus Magasanikbacteria bacterium]